MHFDFFDRMKAKMQTDAQIRIAYHWRKYDASKYIRKEGRNQSNTRGSIYNRNKKGPTSPTTPATATKPEKKSKGRPTLIKNPGKALVVGGE